MNSRQFIWILGLLLVTQSLNAQQTQHYSVVALMDGQGTFYTDSNTQITLPLWGFGWESPVPEVILPAPTIYAYEGDSVSVAMANPSMEGHTIHLHGLDVDEANDGVPHHTGFIQQGESFTYRFKATHAGNFLYHCHVTTTMHLALGMYGMVIVYPADSSNRIYTNGPEYDVQHEYLLSDMDARWNADYTAIGGFDSYDPDIFLITGKNRAAIYADSMMRIHGVAGDKHLLRFLNVGYRVNRVIFPENLHAVVHTSDGRVLDQPFQSDTLIIYPGERYSVLAELLDGSSSHVAVDYLDPYRLRFLAREYIPVNDANFSYIVPEVPENPADSALIGKHEPGEGSGVKLFPNPADNVVYLTTNTAQITEVKVWDALGRLVDTKTGTYLLVELDAGTYPTGMLTVSVRLKNGMVSHHRLMVH